ncbi:hypothetical protein C7H19_09125 [Aphanothece hegewaldii CCALA 016]|uniref:DUF6888 domain-containing protein n=1 Tax=Aphanothece hegewaldii CCALA 016 TaxID=2107694 RepID=A0A2T1LZF7_9CHRO|nr:hypothetical protein C7H19_09125 [Aphanothece hegewaldii CCALA 016]
MFPTAEQGLACIILCQYLTNFYHSIELLRFDERDGIIYIFAGEELQIKLEPNGIWDFLL